MCEHIYTFEKGATFAKGDGKWTPITQQLFHKGWVTFFKVASAQKPQAQTNQPVQNDCFWLLVLLGVAVWYLLLFVT